MTSQYSPITPEDILSLQDYEIKRAQWRQKIIEIKRPRRIAVGPDITFYFENRETLLWQIQEMLYIEKGGEEQLKDELLAYNSLVPKGDELVATMMIEIDDMERRRMLLKQLSHIENHVSIDFDDKRINVLPEDDVERTDASGKTSSVHFFHFPMTPSQSEKFKKAHSVTLTIQHPYYSFSEVLTKESLESLQKDL